MEVIGERWSLLIVRELMLGGRRFSDLRRSLPGISAKVLTERLENLERSAVLIRRIEPPPASVRLYELTEWGYEAEGMLQEMGRWAARSPLHDPTMPLSSVSLMLSMRTMFDREAATEFSGIIGFIVGEDHFLAEVGHGELNIRRSNSVEDAKAVFATPSAPVIAAAFFSGQPLSEFEGSAGLQIIGDRTLAQRYSDMLELPAKIA